MRLGQVHRPGPLAGDHGRARTFCLSSSLPLTSSDAIAPEVRPWYISKLWLADRIYSVTAVPTTCGRPCPPYSSGAGQGRPAGLDELLVSLLEARRSDDRAVVVALAANLVADAVQRRQHLGSEAARLLEDRLDQVGRRVGEARQVRIAADVQHVVEDEPRLAHRRGIGGHLLTSVSAASIAAPCARPAAGQCIRRSAVAYRRREGDRR